MKQLIKEKTQFIYKIYIRLIEDDIFALSSQMAYPLIMSIIPMIMFILTLAGISEELIAEIYDALKFVLPTLAFNIIKQVLDEVLYASSFTYPVLFSTIYFISIGIRGIMKGLNKAYRCKENRNIAVRYMLSFIFAILLGIGILLSFAVLIFGQLILKGIFAFLNINIEISFLIHLVRYIAAYTILGFIFCIIYIFTPNLRLKFKDVYKGGYFASLCWIIVSVVFGYYINHFSKYSLLFGSLGGIFILFVWTYMTSAIILLGGELNAILYENKYNVK